ncbi:ABC transporter permease [Brevibacillus fulvus]|uniref:ABC-2 type transport system permease protein n=1 Tax=Brevibacillus fulvus TaxID=1125967 RepID=A0A939BQU1_9BACL|nr:ABC-2 family transporter protein [Brevibacillus fulvus]MBM7588887.1 ABC-2 type transport system permease protein [Brevibacillus fulvus]
MLHKYAVLLRMKWVEMFEYRLASLVWVFGAMTQPLITMLVWMNIDREASATFILYFASLIVVERLTTAWDVWELDREIREGSFSYYIVRPFAHVHWAIAENLVYKLVFFVILAPVWLVAAIFVPALRLKLDWGQLALFVFALLIASAIRFLFSYSFGLLGFWVTKVTAIYGMLEAISLFFSGRIAPLSFLPPVIQQLSFYLPFRYMVGFPVELLTGDVHGTAGDGFLLAIFWMLCFLALTFALWKRGLKKNQAVGG